MSKLVISEERFSTLQDVFFIVLIVAVIALFGFLGVTSFLNKDWGMVVISALFALGLAAFFFLPRDTDGAN